MTTTARLDLPMIEPGQAQKEMFHNEALTLIDLAVQAGVTAIGLDVPPVDPAIGACWIVGAAPTGAWAGRAQALAGWTAGGWRFVAAHEGMTVWNGAVPARFTGGGWEVGVVRAGRLLVDGEQVVGARRAAIDDPAGGTMIDVEARAGITAILAALQGHGLIAR